MRLTVLGSGTVVPEPGRACASYYIEAGAVRLLLDCGPGATQAMAARGLPWTTLTHIALSHFHTDHIGDLPYLLFALKYGLDAPRTEPLMVLGPTGTVDMLRALAGAFGSYILDPGFRLTTRELGAGHQAPLAPGVRLAALKSNHTEESIAYRLESDGATLGYTGDTGPDDALAYWLRGVDLLLAECSLPDDLGFDRHMTPTSVAALASIAQPRRLLLTHVYPQLDRRALPRLVADAGWPGEVIVAEEGGTLEV